MLNDKIETAEIADTELDAISGGVGVAAETGVAGVTGGAAVNVEGLPAVSDVTGAVNGVAGTVTGVAGAATGVAGGVTGGVL